MPPLKSVDPDNDASFIASLAQLNIEELHQARQAGAVYRTPPSTPARKAKSPRPPAFAPPLVKNTGIAGPRTRSASHASMDHSSSSHRGTPTSSPSAARRRAETGPSASGLSSPYSPAASPSSSITSISEIMYHHPEGGGPEPPSSSDAESEDHPTPTPSLPLPPKRKSRRASADSEPVGNIFQDSISTGGRRKSTPAIVQPVGTPKSTARPKSTAGRESTKGITAPLPSQDAAPLITKTTCSGITGRDQRCRNQVKQATALGEVNSEADEEIPRFCHHHQGSQLKPDGFFSHKANKWVLYKDWILPCLQLDTQAALRTEMTKQVSKYDGKGFIYSYEIQDEEDCTEVRIKVGRSVDASKRMDQWRKQCGRDLQPRGVFQTNYCARAETLIHLILADLARNMAYTSPDFHDPSRMTFPGRISCPAKVQCTCGATHKEIFTFKKFGKGKSEGLEHDVVVKGVIESIVKFVDIYAS